MMFSVIQKTDWKPHSCWIIQNYVVRFRITWLFSPHQHHLPYSKLSKNTLCPCIFYLTTTLTEVWTPSRLIVSHEHFLLTMCLHGFRICYVCYVLNIDYRFSVKSIQLRVKLLAGYVTILMANNENLLACQVIFQPPLTEVRTPSHVIVSHEHFLLTTCLHGSLICYVR